LEPHRGDGIPSSKSLASEIMGRNTCDGPKSSYGMELLKAIKSSGVEAYIVGAAARAVLLGIAPPGLVEVAAGASCEDLEGMAREAGCEETQRNPEVVTARYLGRPILLTPFRFGKEQRAWGSEVAAKLGSSISEHLLGYHFKLEGVALSADGKLLDAANAKADASRRIVSTRDDPEEVFQGFPFAMLRAAALMSETGFSPAPNVLSAATRHSHNITTVPPSAWREELQGVLMGDFPGEALDFLADTRLCNFVLPELTNLIGFEATIEYHHKDLWEHTKLAVSKGKKEAGTRWALLLHDIGKVYTRTVEDGDVRFHKHEQVSRLLAGGILYRLRFARDLRNRILFLISNHMKPGQYVDEWTDSAVRRLMRTAGDMLDDLIDISQADVSSKNPVKVSRNVQSLKSLLERIDRIREEEACRIVLPKGLGNAVMEEFGLDPSPEVGKLVGEVTAAIEEGRLARNGTVEEYLEYLADRHGSGTKSGEPAEGDTTG